MKFTIVFRTDKPLKQDASTGAAVMVHRSTGILHGVPELIGTASYSSYYRECTSLEAAWKFMNSKLSEGDRIVEIVFISHGAPGYWTIPKGPTKKTEAEKYILTTADMTGNTAEQIEKQDLLREMGKYCDPEKTQVILEICNQAEGDEGDKFMLRLAELLRAKVHGWTGEYSGGPTGSHYVAEPGATENKKVGKSILPQPMKKLGSLLP